MWKFKNRLIEKFKNDFFITSQNPFLRLISALIPLGRINFHSNSQYLIQGLSNIIKET
jgi:hypothetical protein